MAADPIGRLRAQPGAHLLEALKAARDAVNLQADAKGDFPLVAVDRDSVVVNALTRVPNPALLGAIVMHLAIA